jgi:iron-sulfur cluster repair protein YtfE (RIC family)
MLEHTKVQTLMSDCRSAVGRGNFPVARGCLVVLDVMIRPHIFKEETQLFPYFDDEAIAQIEVLIADHNRVKLELKRILALDLGQIVWAEAFAMFEDLLQHMRAEDDDLFPASNVMWRAT